MPAQGVRSDVSVCGPTLGRPHARTGVRRRRPALPDRRPTSPRRRSSSRPTPGSRTRSRSGCTPTSSSATSTVPSPAHVERAESRRARGSTGTRPTRTPPTSSSRSTRRATLGATEITVLGAGGGRLDHFLANLLLLTHADVGRPHDRRAASATPEVIVVRTRPAAHGPRRAARSACCRSAAPRAASPRPDCAGRSPTPSSPPRAPAASATRSSTSPATVRLREGVLLAIQPDRRPRDAPTARPRSSRPRCAVDRARRACSSGGGVRPAPSRSSTHDSFAVSKPVLRGVHAADRVEGAGPEERRRRRGAQPGDPHQGRTARRRVLRRRQHVPHPRARREGLRPLPPAGAAHGPAEPAPRPDRPRDAGRLRRRVRQLRRKAVRATLRRRPRRSTTSRDPRTRTGSWSRTRPRAPPASRSWPRPSRSTATAGSTTGTACAPTTCRSSTAGSRRTTASSPARRGQGHAPARRELRVEPAGRGALRRRRNPRPRRPRPCPPRASARSSSSACCTAPRIPAAARKLVDFMLTQRFQADMPLQMFVFPAVTGTPLPAVFTKYSDGAARPAHAPAGADRPRAGAVDRPVDRTRAAVTDATSHRAARGARVAPRAGAARVPRRLLRLAGRRDPRPRAVARRLARPRRVRRHAQRARAASTSLRFTVWQATLSTLLTLVDRPPAHRRRQPGAVPRPGARARARRSCRSCCPTIVVATAFRSLGVDRSARRDPARALLLQPRRRRARRRRVWETSIAAPPTRRAVLGAGPVRTFRSVTLPALRPAIVAAGVDRVPVLLHVVRRDPRARRPDVRDARDRDLPADRGAARPARPRRCSRSSSCVAVVAALVVAGVDGGPGRPSPRRRGATAAGSGPRAGTRCVASLAVAARTRARDRPGRRARPALARRRRASAGPGCDRVTDGLPRVAARTRSRTSLGIACAATVIAVDARARARDRGDRGGASRLGRVGELAVMLPLGVSAVTVGFGFLIVFDTPPLDLRTSWWIVPIAHALIALPFVVRTAVPLLRDDRPAPARGRRAPRRVASTGLARGGPAG